MAGEITWRRRLSLMLVLDVSIERRIAEVALAANADIVSLHRIIAGSSLSPGNELLLAFVEIHVPLGLAHEINDKIRRNTIK